MGVAKISTEQIWELLSSRLRSFFRHRVSDEQLAEDLLQETFVHIHYGIQSLDDDERVSAWVFRIARNTLVDHFRRVKPIKPSKGELNIQPGLAEGKNLNHKIAEWLPRVLSNLPEKYRDAVELFELHNVPQQEIADRLGISLSGAKSRVQRGRDKLKETLLQCCHFDFDRRGNVISYRRLSQTCSCCADDEAKRTCS